MGTAESGYYSPPKVAIMLHPVKVSVCEQHKGAVIYKPPRSNYVDVKCLTWDDIVKRNPYYVDVNEIRALNIIFTVPFRIV